MLSINHAYYGWSKPLADLRATQLAQTLVNGTSPTTVYTTPTGKRCILKSLVVQNYSGTGSDVQLRVGTLGTIMRLHVNAYGSGGDSVQAFYWLVLNPGEVIQITRVSAGQVGVQLSGSEHTI